MIPRYSNKEMQDIWSEEEKYSIFLEVEILACEGNEKISIIPKGTAKRIRENASFNIDNINTLEKELKHDVIAFLTNVKSYIGEDAKYFHYGMTSSDLLDTTLSVQMKRSCELILHRLDTLINSLQEKAIEYKYTPCMGRSHGIHGEPITFGIKMLRFVQEFSRAKKRLEFAIQDISVCKISGAMGIYSSIDPSVEKYVADKLQLIPEDVASQVIARDRHGMLIAVIANMASSIENMATEIRHLQRTEVNEVMESFSSGQKGSSAMPHKRNPVLSENLTGLARVIRSYVIPCMENITLWHERDISHSSVERIIMPDCFMLTDFALSRANEVISSMKVLEKNMEKNMSANNEVFYSQKVMLALIDSGMSREDAYYLVQKNAMKAMENNINFMDLIKSEESTKDLSSIKEIKIEDYLEHVDFIYKRSKVKL